MSRLIANAKLLVLSLFFVASAGAVWYDWAYIWPVKRCDERGAWWDAQDRECLTPMPIWRITGRRLTPPPGAAGAPVQRVAAGTQSTSASPRPLANRAATNSRSDSRLR